MLTAILIFLNTTESSGNFFTDYFRDRYTLRMVETLPDDASNRILIISTRFFKPENNYMIKRGLHPRYRLFHFIAGIKGDTAFVAPIESLAEVSGYLPDNRDFLVYVDGHGKTFGQTMERGFALTGRFNINLVVFDWPSDYLALRKTAYNADEVSAGFVIAMRDLSEMHENYFRSSSVSVMFHSMGNRILKNISTSRLLDNMPKMLFTNIIINAAAVKKQNHAHWIERLNIQKRIYITVNDSDINLRGASMLRLAEQLGRKISSHLARNAFYVNFSNIATSEHNLFLGKSQSEEIYPDIFDFYDMAFHSKEARFTDHTSFQIFSPSDKSFLFSVR